MLKLHPYTFSTSFSVKAGPIFVHMTKSKPLPIHQMPGINLLFCIIDNSVISFTDCYVCKLLNVSPASHEQYQQHNNIYLIFLCSIQELMIDNIVVPVASGYGLQDEYKYLKSSIKNFLTGPVLSPMQFKQFSLANFYSKGSFGRMQQIK